MSIGGCGTGNNAYTVTVGEKPNAVTIARTQEAATYAANVVAISRWRDVEKALQPAFKIDEASALTQVMPLTSREDVVHSHARSLGVGIGLAPDVVSGTDTQTTTMSIPIDPLTGQPIPNTDKATGTLATNSTRTETLGPPTVPTATPPTSTLTGEALSFTEVGLEPRLRYDLAAALMQHVRLLNRQVTDSVRREGYVPYVVTLKLTTQPIRPDLPLDVYFDTSLFVAAPGTPASPPPSTPPSDPQSSSTGSIRDTSDMRRSTRNLSRGGSGSGSGSGSSAATLSGTSSGVSGSGSGSAGSSDLGASDTKQAAAMSRLAEQSGPKRWIDLTFQPPSETTGEAVVATAPVVLPLLSGDSIEGQLRSLSDSDVRSTALALSAMFRGVGASVNASDIEAELRRRIGRRTNSLLSIVRLNENTLRIRLGAAFSPEDQSDHAMSTRENVMSLVVLLPKDAILNSEVIVAARPHLRSTLNGLRLRTGDAADVTRYVSETLKRNLNEDAKKEDIEKLAETLRQLARHSNLNEFINEARLESGSHLRETATLWLTALGAYDGPMLFDKFAVKGSTPVEWPRLLRDEKLQEPVLAASEKQAMITLSNGMNLDALDSPSVSVFSDGGVPIPASTVVTAEGGTVLKASFGALSTWPGAPKEPEAPKPGGQVPKPLPPDAFKDWTVRIDFVPPVPVSSRSLETIKLAVPSLATLTRLPNDRLRLEQSGLRYVKVPTPPEGEPKLTLTADQGAIRVTKQPFATLTLRVTNLPKGKDVYLRVRNASLAQGQPASPLLTNDGVRLKLTGDGLLTLPLDNVVSALPVIIETYEVKENKDQAPQQHLVIPVTE